MRGPSSPCWRKIFVLTAYVVECRAFRSSGDHSPLHPLPFWRRCQTWRLLLPCPRENWSLSNRTVRTVARDKIRNVHLDDWFVTEFQSATTVAAASLIFAGASFVADLKTANALDVPPTFTVFQNERVLPSSRNHLEVAFGSLMRKEILESKSITLAQPHTLLGSINTAEDIQAPAPQANSDSSATEVKASLPQAQPNSVTSGPEPSQAPKSKKGQLQPIDVKKIAENKIDVELICSDDQRPPDASTPVVKIDRETFQKVKIYQPPFLRYLPSSIQPLASRQLQSLQVLKSIPNDQLFVASVFAGSITEIIRTTLLYPLITVKSRVQARTSSRANHRQSIRRKLRVSWLTFVRETRRGDWYAGIIPSLLVTVPASGVYSGVKDVSRRAFSAALRLEIIQNLFPTNTATASYYSSLVVNLLAAFVSDIASLAIRTPADVLSLRLQVFGDTNVRSDFGSWAKDSVALLPAMIVTDIPFLMSKIFLNAAITTGGEGLGQYEFETIAIACLCAFLTTPFDVARTRILLPTLPSEEEEEPSTMLPDQRRRLIVTSKQHKQRQNKLSVTMTMRRIAAEGNGGVQNLYAGWLERTAYLGLGRAWLDPLRVIGYLGIRDALLLKLFD